MEKTLGLKSYSDYLILTNFSVCTQKMYLRTIVGFYKWREEQKVEGEIKQEDAQQYLLMRVKTGSSWSTINCDYSALRKYYKQILEVDWSLKKMPRPRRENKLPEILSKAEVVRIIEHAPLYKHQVFLTFIYGTGCRLGEACRMRLEDIDSDRMQVRVRQGKGQKDRYVLLSQKLLDLLRIYYKRVRPKQYLFNGQKRGMPLSKSAGQRCMQRGRIKSGVKKRASVHTLRHCYATHHIESGTDLVYLKEQLGHKHLKTTAVYVHLCMERYRTINHPLDDLEIQYS
jgi:site-specific recombinase XerD